MSPPFADTAPPLPTHLPGSQHDRHVGDRLSVRADHHERTADAAWHEGAVVAGQPEEGVVEQVEGGRQVVVFDLGEGRRCRG